MKAEVSVIMSCFNAESTIHTAIKSILNQTFDNFEFIIIDDGSTDKTRIALKEFAQNDKRIRLRFNSSNQGLAASLNIGIQMAHAPFIARMDADDESIAERLEKQLQYISLHKDIDILGSGVWYKSGTGELLEIKLLPERHDEIVKLMFKKTPVFHPTILIKKEVFKLYGMYDPSVTWAEDSDLWYRIYDKVRFHNLQEPLLIYTLKKRLSFRQARYNLMVKIRNLSKRKMLVIYFPQLAKDFLIMAKKMIRF